MKIGDFFANFLLRYLLTFRALCAILPCKIKGKVKMFNAYYNYYVKPVLTNCLDENAFLWLCSDNSARFLLKQICSSRFVLKSKEDRDTVISQFYSYVLQMYIDAKKTAIVKTSAFNSDCVKYPNLPNRITMLNRLNRTQIDNNNKLKFGVKKTKYCDEKELFLLVDKNYALSDMDKFACSVMNILAKQSLVADEMLTQFNSIAKSARVISR